MQPTEQEIKVSQIPCPHCNYSGKVDSWDETGRLQLVDCLACQGTDRLYPGLSREKEIMIADPDSVDGLGNAIIRVPDVTLEKVMKLLPGETIRFIRHSGKVWCCADVPHDCDGGLCPSGEDETDAVCAALLASQL